MPSRVPTILGGAILLAGCGSSGSSGKIELRYMAWGSPEQLALEQHICDEFNQRNPDLDVKFFRVPGNSYMNKAIVMLASRTAPDVMRIEHFNFPQLVKKDYFLDLGTLTKEDKTFKASDFFPWTLAEGTYQGKLYGLNTMSGAVILYYNKSMIKAARLEDPNDLAKRGDWTYDRFRQYAIAMSRRDREGHAIQLGCQLPLFPFTVPAIWSFGGDVLSADHKHCLLASPAAIQAYQYFMDLRWKDHCAPTLSEAANGSFAFESGRLGMDFNWMGNAPRYNVKIKSFDWDICPIPSGPHGNTSIVKGNQLVIARESDHPKEAWRFIKFLTSHEIENVLYVQNRRNFPTRKDVAYSPEFLNPKTRPFSASVFLKSVENSRQLPIDDRWAEWSREFTMREESLFTGQRRDVSNVLNEAVVAIDKILNDEEGF